MQALIVPTFFMALFLYFGALCGFFDVDYEVFSEYHYAAEMLLVAIRESLTKKKTIVTIDQKFFEFGSRSNEWYCSREVKQMLYK